MGADVHEPRFDLGPPNPVRAFGFGHERGALLVGREHHLDEALGAARRLLGDGADAHALRQRDCTAFARDLALHEPEQGRLAGAVAADEPDARAWRQRAGGVVEDQAFADPVGQVRDVKHGRVVAIRARNRKTRHRRRSTEGVPPAYTKTLNARPLSSRTAEGRSGIQEHDVDRVDLDPGSAPHHDVLQRARDERSKLAVVV